MASLHFVLDDRSCTCPFSCDAIVVLVAIFRTPHAPSYLPACPVMLLAAFLTSGSVVGGELLYAISGL